MSRPVYLSIAAALLVAAIGLSQAPSRKSALDKATLEAYVRHLYVWDSRITIQVSDPKPSADLPGFQEVVLRASMGGQSQDVKFLVSKDGQKVLQGSVFDINNNPFKSELDKLKTSLEPSMGTAGAPVVLVEFSDFECPYCRTEATMLRQNLVTAYPKQVRLYFKTYPLENLHPWAKSAAIASRCVHRQQADAFWDFHDWIFEHQTEVTPENFKEKVMDWAKGQKNLDALQLNACIDSKATEAEVKRDQDEGQALGVTGTPTLFVNGRKIGQSIDWATLRNMIDYEIEYQKTAKNAGDDCGCELKLNLPGLQPPITPSLTPKKN